MSRKKYNRYLCMICQNAKVKTASSICEDCCNDDIEVGAVRIGACKKDKNKWSYDNA